jgi:hypothetical protein
MSYKINTTDGTLLVDLIDGKIDTATTDLTLVGRNYTGYGEAFNENFVKLLENFASTSQPDNPIRGQIWFDATENRLKVYDGELFRSTDTTLYSATRPSLIAGDIWIDSSNKQMYFSDGVSTFLAGPEYSNTQGKTNIDAITLIDRFGVTQVVGRMTIANVPVAIISKESFTAANIDENISLLQTDAAIFSLEIKQGFNLTTNLGTFNWQGTATTSLNLKDSAGDVFAPGDFIQVSPSLIESVPQTTNHYFEISSDFGLLLGAASDLRVYVDTTDNDNLVIKSQRSGKNINVQINNGSVVDALTIAQGDVTHDAFIGILTTTPAYPLDVTGDVRITGNLTVEGDTSYLDVGTLRVEDKNIELGLTEDSTPLSNGQLDNAGIIVPSSDVQKDWTWKNATNSWTSNNNIDIDAGGKYKIGGSDVLSTTALAPSVTTATGLVQVGTLQSLSVDDITLNGSTITVGNNLRFDLNGDLIVSISSVAPLSQVKNIANPTSEFDAANKGYVDDISTFDNAWLSLDITLLSNDQIADVINDLIPATSKKIGVECRVHCTSYSGTVTTDVSGEITKSFINVDSNGVQNVAVLQNVGFSAGVDPVVLTVTRSLKLFTVDSSQEWVYISELASSV